MSTRKKVAHNSFPLVSVIIPVHNRFSFVDEAIQSVFEQTHRPIQLILVDDYSAVPYQLKLASQPDFEIILIRHDSNQGPGTSRETGRQAASGDYIVYLDSDDLWHPTKLKKQIAILQEHPDAGMCYCQSLLFFEWPLIGNETFWPKSNYRFDRFLPIVLEFRPWGTSACVWTREATEKIGPWHFGWHYEDVVYDVKAGCQDIKIAYLPEVCCYYRRGSEVLNLSLTKSDFAFTQQAQSIEIIINDLIDNKLIRIDKIRTNLETRLYKTIIGAFHRRKRSLARCFLKYLRFITHNSDVWFYGLLLSICSYLLPIRLIDSIHYRKQHIIFSDKSSDVLQGKT